MHLQVTKYEKSCADPKSMIAKHALCLMEMFECIYSAALSSSFSHHFRKRMTIQDALNHPWIKVCT